MSSEASQQMMALLQELAVLKEIDSRGRARTREEKAARRERQRRRAELCEQIKQIAGTRKNKSSLKPPRTQERAEALSDSPQF